MLVGHAGQSGLTNPECGLLAVTSNRVSEMRLVQGGPVRAAAPLEVSALQLGQLAWDARRALATAAPTGPIAQRTFTFADRAVILLAARVPYGRRAPRDPALIRRTLELGTGLQLRAIGRLAVVALELPFAPEAIS